MAKSKNRKPATNTIVIEEPEETANDLVEEIGENAAEELEEITADVEVSGDVIVTPTGAIIDVEEDQDEDGKDDGNVTVDQPEEPEPAQTLEVLENRVLELATKLVASYTGGEVFTQEDKEEMAALNTAIASYTSGDQEATAKKISKSADAIGTVALSAAAMGVFAEWVETLTTKDKDGNVLADVGDLLASFNDRPALLSWGHLDGDGKYQYGKDGDGKSLLDGDLAVPGRPAGDGLGDFHVAWSGKAGETLVEQIQEMVSRIALYQWLDNQLVQGHSLKTGTITGKVVLEEDGRRRVNNYLYAATATFKKTGIGRVTGGTGDGATASTEYQNMKKDGNGTVSIMEPFTVRLVTGGELEIPACAEDDIQYLCEKWIESDGNGRAPRGKATPDNCNRWGGPLGNVAKTVTKDGVGYYHGPVTLWTNTPQATTGMKWLTTLERMIRAAAVEEDRWLFAQAVTIGNTATKRLIDMETMAKIKETMPVEPVDQPEDGNQDGDSND